MSARGWSGCAGEASACCGMLAGLCDVGLPGTEHMPQSLLCAGAVSVSAWLGGGSCGWASSGLCSAAGWGPCGGCGRQGRGCWGNAAGCAGDDGCWLAVRLEHRGLLWELGPVWWPCPGLACKIRQVNAQVCVHAQELSASLAVPPLGGLIHQQCVGLADGSPTMALSWMRESVPKCCS